MDNYIHSMAPKSHSKYTRLELCTIANLGLVLSQTIGQNTQSYTLKHTTFAQCLDQYKYTT